MGTLPMMIEVGLVCVVGTVLGNYIWDAIDGYIVARDTERPFEDD